MKINRPNWKWIKTSPQLRAECSAANEDSKLLARSKYTDPAIVKAHNSWVKDLNVKIKRELQCSPVNTPKDSEATGIPTPVSE